MYIELATELRRPLREGEATKRRGGLELGGRPGGEVLIPVSALEATSDHRRLALTGKPGSGKTTFVRHLCLCLAQHLRHPDQGWLERLQRSGWMEEALVPLVVELRFFARSLPPDVRGRPEPRALWDFFVAQSLKPHAMESLQAGLLRTLEAGRGLVVFEGLDEVPTGPQRAYVRQAIKAFAAAAQFRATVCRGTGCCGLAVDRFACLPPAPPGESHRVGTGVCRTIRISVKLESSRQH